MSLNRENLFKFLVLIVSDFSFLSCVESFDVLEVLILLYDEFGELHLQRLALHEEILVGELMENLLLFPAVIFSLPLALSTLILLGVFIGVRPAGLLFHFSLVVADEFLVVMVCNWV